MDTERDTIETLKQDKYRLLGLCADQEQRIAKLEAENAALRAALVDARKLINGWASAVEGIDMMQDELDADLARIDAVLERSLNGPWTMQPILK